MRNILLKCLFLTFGFVTVLLAAFSIVSLFTYSYNDASFNYATNLVTNNMGGKLGAQISEIIVSIFGYAGFFVLAAICLWGAKLSYYGKIRKIWWQMLSLCIFLSTVSIINLFFINIEISNFDEKTGFIGYLHYFVFYDLVKDMKLLEFLVIPVLLALSFISLCYTYGIKMKRINFISYHITNVVLYVIYKIRFIIRYKKSAIQPKQEEATQLEFEYPQNNEPEEQEITIIQPQVPNKMKSFSEFKSIIKQKIEDNKPSVFTSKPITSNFALPSVTLLNSVMDKMRKNQANQTELTENARRLEKILSEFGVSGKIIKINPGPVVTLYEFEPSAGTKSARVIGLADDIARSMSTVSARISVVSGKNALGIEIPNSIRDTVYFREVMGCDDYRSDHYKLPLILGKNISGEAVVTDLTKMPHLLVAGTTGSGKSVGINTMILSLLFRLRPDECKFIMIDPKMLELSIYDGIPHLLAPVVTEPGKAVVALKWTIKEMESRYKLMSQLGVRNILGFNKKIEEALDSKEEIIRTVQTGFDAETGKPIYEKLPIELKKLPYIVVIIDEMADLMLVAGKEIEGSVQRLAQMARAAGIHIITATQRPSVDVITGVIKANFPTRISFQVTSRIDSRTILGDQGAEQLLGMGDMLFMPSGSKTIRVHGAFIEDAEVERIVSFLKSQGEPDYVEDVTTADETSEQGYTTTNEGGSDDDKLYNEAVSIVMRDRKASTSYIQRCLRIGYNRAAIIIEKMEKEGVVSSPNHVGKREVLLK